jgi:hypothetical protein
MPEVDRWFSSEIVSPEVRPEVIASVQSSVEHVGQVEMVCFNIHGRVGLPLGHHPSHGPHAIVDDTADEFTLVAITSLSLGIDDLRELGTQFIDTIHGIPTRHDSPPMLIPASLDSDARPAPE